MLSVENGYNTHGVPADERRPSVQFKIKEPKLVSSCDLPLYQKQFDNLWFLEAVIDQFAKCNRPNFQCQMGHGVFRLNTIEIAFSGMGNLFG